MSLDKIPRSRTLPVTERYTHADVLGSVHIKPGERLAYAIEFKDAELPLGELLYVGDDNPFDEPSVSGADAADMAVEDYELHDTQVRFEVSLDEESAADAVIELGFKVPLSATELVIVSVPVVVEA
jgi:hypothetical protein